MLLLHSGLGAEGGKTLNLSHFVHSQWGRTKVRNTQEPACARGRLCAKLDPQNGIECEIKPSNLYKNEHTVPCLFIFSTFVVFQKHFSVFFRRGGLRLRKKFWNSPLE
jgi:hypothetical protein